MKTFKASLDNIAIILTLFVAGISVSLFISIFKTGDQLSTSPFSVIVILNIFILILFISFFILRPTGYSINESVIIVNRLILPFKINRKEIANCSIVSKDEMSGTYRTFGNGGLFGYTGYFRNTKFGNMRWFATQRKNYVLIEKSNGKKIVITPDIPEDFIEALK